ncbi:unnamed protein product [Heligmosomoides polygyrus]|uniref:Velvet domain-containing protein n=1 Tax=Heligmosomoides polygyrus TaxID=6339 RepID=A0A183GN49_HELPZ|nr:unnamed protein product [Heligmosomoides polygyrus]
MKSLQPDSAYDYSPYSHNVRRAPMHSDYDYTSLAGQAIPYARQPTIFMQPPPMPLMPYQSSDYGSQADTGMENDDITNQFTGIPRGTKLRRPVTPNNEVGV